MPKEEGLREKGDLESQEGVVSLHFECSMGRLRHPAGVGRRLEQPGAGSHSWEVEEKGQPWLLGEVLSADSFYAAWRKPFWRHVWSWSLHQTHGESILQERGEVWGVEGQGLGALGMEEGLLQRLGEAGMKGLAWHGRGQLGTKELEGLDDH